MNSIFSHSFPVAGFDQNPQEKNDFVLIKFEHTEIDKVRETSESGVQKISFLPAIRKTTMELVIFSGVPLS